MSRAPARTAERLDRGEGLDFLPETKHIRESDWNCAPIPRDLRDRRVEITGPTDRKMVINALNSGAKMFMADFEDANSPTWANMVEGQINLRDAIRGTITFTNPEGKKYRLNEKSRFFSSGHAAGIWSRNMCWSMANRSPAGFSILACFFSTTRRN